MLNPRGSLGVLPLKMTPSPLQFQPEQSYHQLSLAFLPEPSHPFSRLLPTIAPLFGHVAPVQGSQISLTFSDKKHSLKYPWGLPVPTPHPHIPTLHLLLTSCLAPGCLGSLVLAALYAKGSSRFLLDFLCSFLSDLWFRVTNSLSLFLPVLFQVTNPCSFLFSLSDRPSSSAFTQGCVHPVLHTFH